MAITAMDRRASPRKEKGERRGRRGGKERAPGGEEMAERVDAAATSNCGDRLNENSGLQSHHGEAEPANPRCSCGDGSRYTKGVILYDNCRFRGTTWRPMVDDICFGVL